MFSTSPKTTNIKSGCVNTQQCSDDVNTHTDFSFVTPDLQGLSAYLVWRGEHEAVVLLHLQQAPQSLELMDLGEHSLPGQQHVQVAAFIQHLADGSDGAVQLGQTLVQFLHLQVQRLGLHLTDLLHLKGDGTLNSTECT